MVAIGIRDDETRSDLHRNFIEPFTTKPSTRVVGQDNESSADVLDEEIDGNIINDSQASAKRNAKSTPRWKFENYNLDNWDDWKENPFILNDGEDTSKYFR